MGKLIFIKIYGRMYGLTSKNQKINILHEFILYFHYALERKRFIVMPERKLPEQCPTTNKGKYILISFQ